MTLQIAEFCEAQSTQVTFERLLPSMNAHMTLQIAEFCEAQSTHFTFERLLSSMSAHVHDFLSLSHTKAESSGNSLLTNI